MDRLFSYISGDTLTYFHIIQIFITYPIAPAKTINIVLNRGEEDEYPCLLVTLLEIMNFYLFGVILTVCLPYKDFMTLGP